MSKSERSAPAGRRTDYSQIAPGYDELRGRRHPRPDSVVAAYAGQLGNGRITGLDVGCGTGTFVLTQAEAGISCDWTGLDRSEDMLAQAKEKVPGASWLLGTADALPFETDAFDLVTTSFAFHHFEEKDAALSECVRVLEDGGLVLMHNVAPHFMTNSSRYSFFNGSLSIDLSRHWHPQQIADALTERGLEVHTEVKLSWQRKAVADLLSYARTRNDSMHHLVAEEAFEQGIRKLEQMEGQDVIEQFATVRIIGSTSRELVSRLTSWR